MNLKTVCQKENNSRFLGALGFLGFVGFLGFAGTEGRQYLANLAFLSLLSLGSLLVLVPMDRTRVKVPVDAKKKPFLGFLVFLVFLVFLWSDHPGFAGLACMAAWSILAAGQKQST